MRTVKRLAQTGLSTTITNRYTAPANTTAQITEMYIVNTGVVDRKVDVYQGGTDWSNMIMRGLTIPAYGFVLLQDLKIVITAGQALAAKQDTGTDVFLTMYGIEEV